MDRVPTIILGFTDAAGRFTKVATQILQDRLELLALEIREAKIRFIQALILALIGMIFFLLGLLLLVFGGLYLLTPEWRIYGFAVTAVGSITAGAIVFINLRRRLEGNPMTFDQSLTELKKDISCFLTKI